MLKKKKIWLGESKIQIIIIIYLFLTCAGSSLLGL